MLAAQDRIEVQHELLARLDQARAETDRLFDHVKPEFLYERPIPERHRIVFTSGTWRRSIGTCCASASWGEPVSTRNSTTCLPLASIRSTEDCRPTSRPIGLLWPRCVST